MFLIVGKLREKGDETMAENMIVFTKITPKGEIIDSIIIDGKSVKNEWGGKDFVEVLSDILEKGWRRDNHEPTKTKQLISYTFWREENLLKY
ncbi:MAG: hypothetical protein J7L43_02355 [Candidatus Aenigmarchaeota archaeon]|nr:hypothetical protein [Candidatus Aenigmarchaeota archaeon]